MLTREEIEGFRRDGVLHLKGLFSETEVDGWRRQVLRHFDHPGDAGDWQAALRRTPQSGFQLDPAPSPADHPRLRAVYAALHRNACWTGETELLVRPPHEQTTWLGARAPHLDFPVAAAVRTLANNVLYLADVPPFCGPFMYWPGSHRAAWSYFARHPEDHLAQGSRSQDQIFERILAEMTTEPVQFVGAAGDLLIWHSLLLHSASANVTAQPRIAVFGRWGTPLGDEPVYDFHTDPWSYWDFAPVEPAST